MVMDSRVSEHLDIKLIIGSAFSRANPTEILVKWRPFGRTIDVQQGGYPRSSIGVGTRGVWVMSKGVPSTSLTVVVNVE